MSISDVSSKERENEIEGLLKEIDLFKSKDKLVKILSGGNKRKLQVALAFLGKSKFILLDEPSSGMDL